MPNRVQTERAGIECRVSGVVKERFTLQLFRGTCPNEPAPNASVWGFCLGLLLRGILRLTQDLGYLKRRAGAVGGRKSERSVASYKL
jgi:hypothetical protein